MSDAASPSGEGSLAKVVDLDSGRGLNGFIGKTSEMSWMHRAWQLGKFDHEQGSPRGLHGGLVNAELPLSDIQAASAETFIYFTDEEDLLSVNEDLVAPFYLPEYDTAIVLSEIYFQCTNGTSYFVDRLQFLERLSNYFSRDVPMPSFSDRSFLMKANVLWSFSARWLELHLPSSLGNPESHLIYYARARALGLDHRVPFDHPNLDMIEGSGVLASYLLMNGSVSK